MKPLMFAGALVAALGATISVASAGDSWKGHRNHWNGYHQTFRQGDVTQPRRGAFAYNYRQCFTDEGYGRYSSCDRSR